jgi:cell division protein FtsB
MSEVITITPEQAIRDKLESKIEEQKQRILILEAENKKLNEALDWIGSY